MPSLLTARFHTTVAQRRQLPQGGVPEVAFIGRSNAGKSSAINVLCQRRRLAFSSRTPGRTQALNYFAIGANEAVEGFLVDMPGYGYAEAPGEVRKTWNDLAGKYLGDRPELRGVVLMIDIRRSFTDLDRRMLAWLAPDLPLLVLLTKSDKLGTAQQNATRRSALAELAEQHARPEASVVLFSAETRKGLDEARARIEGWFAADAGEPLPSAGEVAAPKQMLHPENTKTKEKRR